MISNRIHMTPKNILQAFQNIIMLSLVKGHPNSFNCFKINPFRKLYFLLICFLFPYLLSSLAASSQKLAKLRVFREEMEEKVKMISDDLVKVYQQNCTQQVLNCSIKTYDFCIGTGKRGCIKNFPTPSGCLSSGITLSLNSAVRIPNIFTKNNLSTNLREFICKTAIIEQTFQLIQQSNTIQYSYAYIGSSGGALRAFPSFKETQNQTTKQCINYDPRKRPWYVSAITGSKNTIILIDISKTMTSMHPGVRFFNCKVTLQIIFQTLNSFDNVGVVVFSKMARRLKYEKIVPANQQNKQLILQQIKNLQTEDGVTNYTSAIEQGMQMLTQISTDCAETVFLLLTDGYTQVDQQKNDMNILKNLISQKLNQINRNQNSFKLISFVYGVQQNINYTIVKNLTCLYNGIVFRIWDGINKFQMIEKLTSYYIFLSEGMDPNLIKPVWSQPYQDAFGFGTILSATMPIYVPSRKVNKIIGVAAIDVLLSQFQKYGFSKTQISEQLKHQPQCFNSTLQNEQLLYLRCKQGNVTCQQTCLTNFNLSDSEDCSNFITQSVFYDDSVYDKSDDPDKCCGFTIKQFFAVFFTAIVGLALILLFIYLYKKGKFKKLCLKKKNIQENDDVQSSNRQSVLSEQKSLKDPAGKYKSAQQAGIKIYHEPQFTI